MRAFPLRAHSWFFNVPIAALLLFFAVALHAQQEVQIGRAPAYSRAPETQLRRSSPIQLTSGSNWLDTAQRAAVANSYLNVFVPSNSVPTGWVGDVANGVAGSTTQAYRDAVLLRINWFRQMAGVPTPISLSAAYNSEDQQAALMMSANGQLNHNPPSTWTYYTAPGADAAAHSNLCLEYPYLPDPGCVSQYMQDYGTNNQEVGHRRWLLFPQTQNMGTGDVQPPYPMLFANALYVFDSHFYDARPATREAFVAWPPKGYVPYQVVPGRWSFSYPGADFTNATVAMQRNGGAVAVQLESPLTGYGENTLVWEPDNIDGNVSTHWPAPLVDTPITVTVSQVMVGGVSTTFTYIVTVFDPNSGLRISGHITTNGTPFGGVSMSLSGGLTTTTDNAGAYSFGPLDAGTYLLIPTLPGYVFSPSSRSASANTTTADFAAAFCDYSAIGGNLTAAARAGTGSYTYTIAAGCPWTATSNSPWLTVSASTTSGYGPVNVSYSFTTNSNAARTGTITVSGHPINVTQPSAGQSALAGPLNAGVFLNGYWQLDTNGDGIWNVGDRYFYFLISGVGDKPLVGDWNGNGHAKAGVYRGGFWALDYNGSGGWDGANVDRFYAFGGNPGEIPIVGDWNGDGRAKIGVYNKGFWSLDYNGNGKWALPQI